MPKAVKTKTSPVVRTSGRTAAKMPASLLVKFRTKESIHAVSRATVRKLATALGLNETQTTLYALARLRDQVLPAYPPDDGYPSDEVIEEIKRMVPQDDYRPTRSLFEGV